MVLANDGDGFGGNMAWRAVEMNDEELAEVDRWICRLARGRGRLRLRIGQGLAMNKPSQHHDFGFSSFGAYTLERLSVTGRWAGEARALARRLEPLPRIREALEGERIGWCMAEVLARDATPEDEAELLDQALREPIRVMQKRLRARRAERGSSKLPAIEGAVAAGDGRALSAAEVLAADPLARELGIVVEDLGVVSRDDGEVEDDPMHMLAVTAPVEEHWHVEVTRMAIEYVTGSSASGAWIDPLLGEGLSTILSWFPGQDPISDEVRARQEADRENKARLEERRARAERAAEPAVLAQREPEAGDARGEEDPIPDDPWLRERRLRQWCAELTSRELWLGAHLLRFFAADGWRRLGYASETQYAQERLGMSRAAMRKHMRLARQMQHLERLHRAVVDGAIGCEAALLLTRVVGPDTEEAWVEHAKKRTFKHLREELVAVETLARMSKVDLCDMTPPTEEEMEAWFRLEREAVTGAAFRRAIEKMSETAARCDGEAASSADAVVQTSVSVDGHGDARTSEAVVQTSVSTEGDSHARSSDAVVQISVSVDGDSDARSSDAVVQISVSVDSDAGARSSDAVVQTSVSLDGDAGARSGDAAGDAGCAGRDEGEVAASSKSRHRGMVTRYWPVRESTLLFWRQLEDAHARSEMEMSFVTFLCCAFWAAWGPSIGQPQDSLWQHIYDRDRKQCTCPVCTQRHGLEDHHLKFRAHGGGDERENNGTACRFCHRSGVHEGRLRVFPPASRMRWLIGMKPLLEVTGRDKREL